MFFFDQVRLLLLIFFNDTTTENFTDSKSHLKNICKKTDMLNRETRTNWNELEQARMSWNELE